MFVKFCGLTRIEDVNYIQDKNITAIGFVFYKKSPRYLEPEKVALLSKAIAGKGIKRVGLFVDTPAEEIKKITEIADLDVLQIYDNEVIEKLRGFRPMYITSRIKSKDDLEKLPELYEDDYYILDSYSEKAYGGSGETFPWHYLKDFKYLDRTIVAGGISPANINNLLSEIKPYGVDLSSSIEREPGIKSKEKIDDFLERLKEAMNVNNIA